MKSGWNRGVAPTEEEFAAYTKVKEWYESEEVADVAEGEGWCLTQNEFDHICHRYSKANDFWEEQRELIREIHDDEFGR